MTAGNWFWIGYVIALLGSCGWYWRRPGLVDFGPVGLVIFILIGLLGWGVFGAPIR